jgi:hypothetical protein
MANRSWGRNPGSSPSTLRTGIKRTGEAVTLQAEFAPLLYYPERVPAQLSPVDYLETREWDVIVDGWDVAWEDSSCKLPYR